MSDSPTIEPTSTPDSTPELASRWQRLRQNRWSALLIDALVVVTIFLAISAWQTRHLIDRGTPAPALELATYTLDARDAPQLRSLEALRGKRVVIAFWAPWCTVCAMETGTLSALHANKEDDVEVLSVVLGYEDEAEISAFMREHEVDYPVLLGTSQTERAWKPSAFPTIYLIDSHGQIASSLVGYTPRASLLARLALID